MGRIKMRTRVDNGRPLNSTITGSTESFKWAFVTTSFSLDETSPETRRQAVEKHFRDFLGAQNSDFPEDLKRSIELGQPPLLERPLVLWAGVLLLVVLVWISSCYCRTERYEKYKRLETKD